MSKVIKNALVLMMITLVAGVCLGFVYDITKEPIAKQGVLAKESAYKAVFPEMDTMTPLSGELPEDAGNGVRIEEAYLALDADGGISGLLVNVTTSEGYGGDINFSMGIQKDGTVNGIEILTINETAGLGMKATDDEFKGQFAGKQAAQFEVTKTGAQSAEQIDSISGATITSNAVTAGVNAGLSYFEKIREEGGSFDE